MGWDLEEGDDGKALPKVVYLEDLPDGLVLHETSLAAEQPELVPVTIFADSNTVVGLGRVSVNSEVATLEIHIPHSSPIMSRIEQGYALGFSFTETPAQEIDTSNRE